MGKYNTAGPKSDAGYGEYYLCFPHCQARSLILGSWSHKNKVESSCFSSKVPLFHLNVYVASDNGHNIKPPVHVVTSTFYSSPFLISLDPANNNSYMDLQ